MAKQKKLTNLELSNFFTELALLTKSGMSVYEALCLMKDSTDLKNEKAFFASLAEFTSAGSTLSSALRENGSFPNYAVRMVEVGEKTGKLDAICKSLGSYYKQNDDLSGEIKSAVAYPVIMLLVILAVIYVLFTLVMPVFDRVYESLGVGNAQLLSSLLNAGYVLNTVALVLGGIVVLAVLCFGIMSITNGGRAALGEFFDNSILTRSVSEKLAAHRFAYAMSVMLEGGLSFDSAIELSGEITGNKEFKKKVKRLRYFLDNGDSFAEAVSKSSVFESAYNGMISASARAGQTDTTLMVIAKRYEENVNRKIGNAVAAVEPALVALLSVIVGLVLMSVVIPLVGIMSTML